MHDHAFTARTEAVDSTPATSFFSDCSTAPLLGPLHIFTARMGREEARHLVSGRIALRGSHGTTGTSSQGTRPQGIHRSGKADGADLQTLGRPMAEIPLCRNLVCQF